MNKISLKSVTKFTSCWPGRRLAQTKSLYRENGKHFKAIKSERCFAFHCILRGSPGASWFRLVLSCQAPRPRKGQFWVRNIYNVSVWPLFCVLLYKLIAQCLSYSKNHHLWHGHNVSLLISPVNYRSITERYDLCGRCCRHQSQLAFFPPISNATGFVSFTAFRPAQTYCGWKRLLLVEELKGQNSVKWSEVWCKWVCKRTKYCQLVWL